VEVPLVAGLFTLSAPQFDAAERAAFHGVTVADISLKQVDVRLTLQPDSFESFCTNLSVRNDCVFVLDYPVTGTLEANGLLSTSALSLEYNFGWSSPVAVGETVSRSLSDFIPPQPPSKTLCQAVTASLGGYMGSGNVSWDFSLLGANTLSGTTCNQNINGVSSFAGASLDLSYYYCVGESVDPPPACSEGCTPGYWKNHLERWDGVGSDDFTETIKYYMSFNSVLGVDPSLSGLANSASLLDAASTGGGGVIALNRHTVAALASSDTAIHYPYSVAAVIALYQDAVGAVAGPEEISTVHALLEDANELGCPLSNSWQPDGICTYCYGDEGDCPGGLNSQTGGCNNSTGQGGLLTVSGTGNHAADDLVLTASQLPANTPVIFIMAPESTRTPLNDGNLCLSPGTLKIIRFPTQSSDANGVAVEGPGIVAWSIANSVEVAEIHVGDTWHFQCYYRDPASQNGGNANLTNAAEVSFF
jgi:hypothetical protein